MFENLDLESIQDEKARELIRQLLNLVEQLSADLRDARIEIQRLRDEVNRLKGEQGKPNFGGGNCQMNSCKDKKAAEIFLRRLRSFSKFVSKNNDTTHATDISHFASDHIINQTDFYRIIPSARDSSLRFTRPRSEIFLNRNQQGLR